MTGQGNWEHRNILNLPKPIAQAAKLLGRDEEELRRPRRGPRLAARGARSIESRRARTRRCSPRGTDDLAEVRDPFAVEGGVRDSPLALPEVPLARHETSPENAAQLRVAARLLAVVLRVVDEDVSHVIGVAKEVSGVGLHWKPHPGDVAAGVADLEDGRERASPDRP